MPRPLQARRHGFTLTELMVVVAIVAFLGVLIVPSVVRARAAARSAVIKQELDQLHQAMMTYGTKYGEFPPANVPNIIVSNAVVAGNPASGHLERLFPRLRGSADLRWRNQAAALTFRNEFLTRSGSVRSCAAIRPGTALTLWLYGYAPSTTASLVRGIMPIIQSSTLTLVASGSFVSIPAGTGANAIAPRNKLFDFDLSRTGTNPQFYGAYFPPRCPNSPYVYIDAVNYGSVSSPTSHPVVTSSGTTDYQAEVDAKTGSFFNPDTFQILCAGPDGIWNNDDDLTNFWKGTRRQFQESGR